MGPRSWLRRSWIATVENGRGESDRPENGRTEDGRTEDGRTENGYEEIAQYALRRDFTSSVRLYLQHWMWQRQLGYLLHPDIPTTENMRIADIACGTGIWLIDLAKKLPHAQLDGYDVSTAQYPAAGWLPKNLNLLHLDILKPIPEHLQGKYDVVHVGLVVLVVQHDQPLPVLDNLLSLLKPGGYLQWDEADFGNLLVSSPGPDVPRAGLDELVEKVHGFLLAVAGNKYEWVRELRQVFEQRQLTIIDDKFLPIEDEIALPWTLQHLMASVELIKSIDKPAGKAVDWWKVYDRAAEEVHQGASMRMGMASIVGQKPG